MLDKNKIFFIIILLFQIILILGIQNINPKIELFHEPKRPEAIDLIELLREVRPIENIHIRKPNYSLIYNNLDIKFKPISYPSFSFVSVIVKVFISLAHLLI